MCYFCEEMWRMPKHGRPNNAGQATKVYDHRVNMQPVGKKKGSKKKGSKTKKGY